MNTLKTIGRGACGTVWASETGPAYKREDGNPARSLTNDFTMHQRVLQSQTFLTNSIPSTQLAIQIPLCHNFIKPEDEEWWFQNHDIFPQGHTPCNMIESQRIPAFEESTRTLLIQKFCPEEIKQVIMDSEPDRDCLIRPYLGRRRTHSPSSQTSSRFRAFSLRNYPLHEDQMEELGISTDDIQHYARIMADALAMMHWVARIDASDVEFVLAPPHHNGHRIENLLGDHAMWLLDFDVCRDMSMDINGVEQAVKAFWRNDPFYPRPGKALWKIFREQYLSTSKDCVNLCRSEEKARLDSLPILFIELVEAQGTQ
ncbi:unnamed protein product [Penicillium olsonii]|nr:unnamed protein product [Penicillium olsonii]